MKYRYIICNLFIELYIQKNKMSQLISPLLTAFIIIIFDFQGPTGPNFTSLPTKLIYV